MSDLFHEAADYQHQKIRNKAGIWIAPVTIVTGFLGSGKTTFINHVLSEDSEAGNTEVLVREYSPLSIDDRLVSHIDPTRIHVQPGVFQHVDRYTTLYVAMDRIHEYRFEGFDHLLVEGSGAESPEDLVRLFMMWDMPVLYHLDNVVTIIDAEYGELNLDEFETAAEQIAFADTVLLNKSDLATETQLDRLESRVRLVNPAAAVYRVSYGNISLNTIGEANLHTQLASLPDRTKKAEESMESINSYVLNVKAPLDKTKTNHWIHDLFDTYGTDILRGKGFLCFAGDDYRYEFQSVRKTFHSYAHDLWKPEEKKETVIVLIGKTLPDREKLQQTLESCIA